MKHRTLADLRHLTLFGYALLLCVASSSTLAGVIVARSGAIESGSAALASAVGATAPDSYESGVACGNGFDDDSDGVLDCSDADCAETGFCTSYEHSCSNNRDDDYDGLVDCTDIECASAPSCISL